VGERLKWTTAGRRHVCGVAAYVGVLTCPDNGGRAEDKDGRLAAAVAGGG
jgi:hypothetical protein